MGKKYGAKTVSKIIAVIDIGHQDGCFFPEQDHPSVELMAEEQRCASGRCPAPP